MTGIIPDGGPPAEHVALLGDLRALIRDARERVAHAANSALTTAYWLVGRRLLSENLTEGRGEYGRRILASLSQELEAEFGRGFSYSSLTRMARFAELFPDQAIVASLMQVLTWSHFRLLLPIQDPLAREFYAEMCRAERWSVRTLRKRIGGMLYERTALSRNSEETVRRELAGLRDEGRMTPDLVFRDPYLLDFLGMRDVFSERDLETAILRELEAFLLELGSGFAFVARQKRISVGRDDFYLDLLFFHRRLRRLVAVELKLESFQPAHTGQMELYLRWLDRHERAPGEEAPIGLILCAGADAEQVELLQLDAKSIRVAEYLTELPPPEVLRDRLHRALANARERASLSAQRGDDA
ncbi:MAG TPA: PDDEXK nuclease domain-containing protein [Longimicrobiaceae bacterium]|nr:PDDEXK nuclease domain-containing protein [Longimicrobiaceae bacterium]